MYVHAKVCVIDDWWATIGSDNFNRRSWTHDSELSAVVVDSSGADHSAYARRLRLTLAAEHLDRELGPDSFPGDISVLDAGRTPQTLDDSLLLEVMADCLEPDDMFDAFASSADALQAWYDGGGHGVRPPGRVRALRPLHISWVDPSMGRTVVPADPRSRWATQSTPQTTGVLKGNPVTAAVRRRRRPEHDRDRPRPSVQTRAPAGARERPRATPRELDH